VVVVLWECRDHEAFDLAIDWHPFVAKKQRVFLILDSRFYARLPICFTDVKQSAFAFHQRNDYFSLKYHDVNFSFAIIPC
jgi:hypothetical protein